MRAFLIVLILFFAANCDAQSQIPKQMPGELHISLNISGGMLRAYTRITIDGRDLKFDELKGNQPEPLKWSAMISDEDLAKLYKAFVDNKFDTIKNDTRKGVVYDAGSENISISSGASFSFHISSGPNSPLSGRNLKRYKAVSQAIDDLVSQYRDKKTTELPRRTNESKGL